MRSIFLNTWLIAFAILVVSFSSYGYALVTGEPHWISRGGSLITIMGLLLTIKHSILSSSRDITNIVFERFHYAVYAPDRGSEKDLENRALAKRMLRDEYFGVIVTILGTIIWGYGDLFLPL